MNPSQEYKKAQITRAHIFEIDLIRLLTVFSVVALHALASTQYLVNKNEASLNLVNLIIHTIQYNRDVFMFITGLVLIYAYFDKPFSATKFWLRRTLLIFIPYLFWSIVYVLMNNPGLDLLAYGKLIGYDLVTGQASYQLYYILLALEFYMIFPFFLILLKKIYHHPWWSLGISLLIQLGLMYGDYRYLQTDKHPSSPLELFILSSQDRIILSYQFFFFFGAFAALYMKQSYAFLKKYGRYSPFILIFGLVFYILYYYHILGISHDIFYATSVLQPGVVVYSILIIFFFFWLAMIWAKARFGYTIIKIISDTSFGIYFVHVFILSAVLKYLLPTSQGGIPAFWLMLWAVIATFGLSVLFCYVLLTVPFLKWTIGRGFSKK